MEARHLLALGDLVISEFMASNDGFLADDDGDYSDWIEIYNRGDDDVSLDGWYLTDDANELDKWAFPDQTLAAGNFLVVFASGKDRSGAGESLHTNFRLGADGEYLALTRESEVTGGLVEVGYELGPSFPGQVADVSYGIRQTVTNRSLIEKGSPARVLFPTNDSLGTAWRNLNFVDQTWSQRSSAIGYESAVPGFTVLDAKSTGTISNLAQATAVLNGTGQASAKTAITPWVNFFDAGGGGGTGNFGDPMPFPNDSAGDDNDFAIRATGTILVPTAGTWTFGTNSDDGLRLRVNGQTVINDDALHGPENRFGQITLAAGPHDIELVFFERGGGAEVELFAASGALTSFNSRAFQLIGDVANGGLPVQTVPGSGAISSVGTYAGVYQSNVAEAMRGIASSAYIRMPWFVANPATLGSVTLRVQYDDGFVAFLNGTEIARRNAPATGTLSSSSVAHTDRSTRDGLTIENIRLTDVQELLQPGINMLAFHGLNEAADGDDFLLAPALAELEVTSGALGYFAVPTPGDFNTSPAIDGFLLDEIGFSHPAGFYETPLQVTLQAETSGTTIRYTTDGSEPTATRGTVYTGPITVSRTTTLRARAFKSGLDPSYVATTTYLFLDDVLQQSPDGTPPTGFPRSTNINGQELDYGMDPQIVNNATWGPQLKSALTQVPSISVVMNVDDLLGASQGIYTHASNHGRAWERPASVELIQPDGSEGFQINAGLRVRGGFSRSGGNPKHAFRLFFRDEYGQGKLEFPLFGNEGTDEFDGIDLRTAQNYSWSFQGDGQNTFLRDVFSRDVQGLMGQPYTRSRFYHLYINGQYWGLFQTQERSEASYAASYFGGDSDDYDVVKSAGSSGGYANEVTDGTMDAYERLAAYFYQAGGLNDTNMSQYWRAQGKNPDGTTNPTYERLLDVDNLIDYMIITYYTGDRDGPASRFVTGRVNNYFGIFNRENPDGFKFFEHDSEHSLDRGDANMVRPYSSGGNNFSYFNPHWMHEQLANNNSEYRQRFADRVHQHLFGDGVLAAENAWQLVNQRAAEIDQAIIAESARWGDAKRSTPFTKTDWERAVGNVRAFITNRVNTVVRQFEQEGWYRPGEAPRFAVNDEPSTGGRIDGDDRISLFSSAQITYSPIVPAQSVWKYLASGQDLGTTWRNPSFNDAAWPSGPGQLGYGDGDEATVVPCGPQAPNCVGNRYPTVYFRHSFQVPDPSVHSLLRMRIQRDDGAAVYLNGVEVARSNLAANATYTTLATSVVGGSEESDWFEFEVDASLLRAGTNVLAVEVHQQSLSSSDLSFDLQLESGTLDQGGGNVYYTLDNTDPRAIGGTVATHAVRYSGVSFQLPGTRTVTARSFVGGVWGPMAVATFLTGTPASAANLRISEINYNPHAPLPAFGEVDVDNDEFEFIELTNVGNEVIDLNDVRFTRTTVGGNDEGIDFRFAPQSLMPGEFLVVAKNRNAFVSRYGSEIRLAESADHPLGTGVFEGSLSNAGETLTVIDAAGSIIQQLRYDDGGDWPGRADGGASSLEVVNFDGDSSLALSYQASILIGGSPGTGVMFASPGPVINEVLTHTDLPQVDAIELYNPTGQAWDISGWYLSDSGENLLRFRLPAGTVLGAGQYRVWDETQLGFGFRGQSSDDAWLIAADANGRPVRFVDHVEFDAAMNGVTLGRWPNGSGALFPQTANSLGRANSGPVPSSIVIAEVHYATDASGLTTLSATEQTFVELWNPSNGQRELSGWRVRGAVDFDFPVGTTLAAGERIVLVAFSPTSSPDRAAAFRARYPSVQQARLFGPFDGALERDGSTVRLLQPEDPLQLGLGFVLVDRVSYESTPPWPAVLASRQSLTRASATSYGDLPSSWQAAAPSPGIASTSTGTGDFDGNGRVDVVDVDLLCVEIRTRGTRSNFDVNGDASINFNDMQFLIQSILGTNFGDASLDGLFNSTDLIQVFQAGQYENAVNGDSTWGTGDWNCDGDFTTADLVLAFQGGAYVAVASPAEAREAVLSDVLDLHALAAASLANEEGSKRTRFGRAYTSEQDAPLATTAVDQVFEQTWQIV